MTIARDILDSEQDAEECVSDVYLKGFTLADLRVNLIKHFMIPLILCSLRSGNKQIPPPERQGDFLIFTIFQKNVSKPLVNSHILCYNKR